MAEKQLVKSAAHLHSAHSEDPVSPPVYVAATHQLFLVKHCGVASNRLLHVDFSHTSDVLCDTKDENKMNWSPLAPLTTWPNIGIKAIFTHTYILNKRDWIRCKISDS